MESRVSRKHAILGWPLAWVESPPVRPPYTFVAAMRLPRALGTQVKLQRFQYRQHAGNLCRNRPIRRTVYGIPEQTGYSGFISAAGRWREFVAILNDPHELSKS